MRRFIFFGTVFLNIFFASSISAIAGEYTQATQNVRIYSGAQCLTVASVPTPEWEIRCGLFPLKQAIGILMERYIEPPDFMELAHIASRAGIKHISEFTYSENAINNLDVPFESVQGANEDYVPDDWQLDRLASALSPLIQKLNEAYPAVGKMGNRAFELLLKETRDAAIAAMIKTLHPHTDYYALGSEERKNVLVSNGEMRKGGKGFAGIGAIIGEFGLVYVGMPLPNTPAGRVLQRYDEILAVDGVAVTTSREAAAKLRGEAGTSVKLSVLRDGVILNDIVLTREIIKPQSAIGILYRINGIAACYLFISNFAEETDKEVDAIFAEGGSCAVADTYVLDLRSNGGGITESAIKTAQKLLPPKNDNAQQELLLQFRNSRTVESYFRDSNESLREWKVRPIILQGPGSASASELVIGILRPFVTLVGDRTFGKFSSYLETVLADGAILTVTNSMFLFQDGVNYDGRGFFPDVQFSRPLFKRKTSRERIMREENLPRYRGKPVQFTEEEKLFMFLGKHDPELAIAFGLMAHSERLFLGVFESEKKGGNR